MHDELPFRNDNAQAAMAEPGAVKMRNKRQATSCSALSSARCLMTAP